MAKKGPGKPTTQASQRHADTPLLADSRKLLDAYENPATDMPASYNSVITPMVEDGTGWRSDIAREAFKHGRTFTPDNLMRAMTFAQDLANTYAHHAGRNPAEFMQALQHDVLRKEGGTHLDGLNSTELNVMLATLQEDMEANELAGQPDPAVAADAERVRARLHLRTTDAADGVDPAAATRYLQSHGRDWEEDLSQRRREIAAVTDLATYVATMGFLTGDASAIDQGQAMMQAAAKEMNQHLAQDGPPSALASRLAAVERTTPEDQAETINHVNLRLNQLLRFIAALPDETTEGGRGTGFALQYAAKRAATADYVATQSQELERVHECLHRNTDLALTLNAATSGMLLQEWTDEAAQRLTAGDEAGAVLTYRRMRDAMEAATALAYALRSNRHFNDAVPPGTEETDASQATQALLEIWPESGGSRASGYTWGQQA